MPLRAAAESSQHNAVAVGCDPFMEDEMPDYDIDFVTGIGDGEGPDIEIAKAMKSTPALWLNALPDDVVILPRKFAENLCPNKHTLEYMKTQREIISKVKALASCTKNNSTGRGRTGAAPNKNGT